MQRSHCADDAPTMQIIRDATKQQLAAQQAAEEAAAAAASNSRDSAEASKPAQPAASGATGEDLDQQERDYRRLEYQLQIQLGLIKEDQEAGA
jgi:hypothetical protein